MHFVLAGQIRLLLWKNWLMKKRHYIRTAFEIFIPLVLFFILWGIKDHVDAKPVTEEIYSPIALPSTGFLSMAESYICDGLHDLPPDNWREERVTVAKQFEMAALSSTGTYERLGQLWMKIAYVYDTIDHRHNHTACNDESAVPAWARDSGLLWRANSSQHSLRDGIACGCTVMNTNAFVAGMKNMFNAISSNSTAPMLAAADTIFAADDTNPSPVLNAADRAAVGDLFDKLGPFFNANFPFLLRAINEFSTGNVDPLWVMKQAVCPRRTATPQQRWDEINEGGGGLSGFVKLGYLFSGAKVNFAPDNPQTREIIRLANRTFDQAATSFKSLSCMQDVMARWSGNVSDTADVVTSDSEGLLVERWLNLRGRNLDNENETRFMENPNIRRRIASDRFNVLHNLGSNYLQRVRGRFKPTVDGTYTFWVSGDDHVSLYVGTDGTRASRRRVAYLEGNSGTFCKDPSQRSAPMQLKAGNFYYIEAVHKERNGGDQMYVSIQHECDATLAECQAANEKYRAEPPYCGEGKNWHRNATTSIALIDGQLYYPDPLFDNVTEADIPVDKGVYDSISDFDVFRGYKDELALEGASAGSSRVMDVLGGIQFHGAEKWAPGETPDHLNYSVRVDPLRIPPTTATRKKVSRRWGEDGWYLYYFSGFTLLQDSVDRAFMDLKTGRDSSGDEPLLAQKMPTPPYVSDEFADDLADILPIFLTLSYIYTASMLIKAMVYEREQRLKETMNIMGMRPVAYWLGWVLTAMAQLTLSAVGLTLSIHYGQIVLYSNPVILFIFIEVFTFATICFSLMVSTIFEKSTIAAAAGGLIYFLMYVPYPIVSEFWGRMTFSQKAAASLSSTTAFGLGGLYIAELERLDGGVQWHNIWDGLGGCDQYSFAFSIMMMLVDGVVYLVIAAYVTAVLPGEFGVPKHPLFFLRWARPLLSYCQGRDSRSSGSHRPECGPKGDRGIIISLLSKVYTSSCSSERVEAVKDVSIHMEEGHVTTLLGSNGAGKTTTMSIITGLFPQTSGRVDINGLNTRTDIDPIRRGLGLCPQHNVLFPYMTPVEHLAFCAAMRGMKAADVKAATEQLLAELGLSASHNVRAANLSGGQKRKLSVAMAFMGDPDVVILDEPTAGMDPSARRQTWDAILARRESRTIMLSTHYLDEADLLSDRIAIMSRGKLLCVDTPMALKKEYGSGFSLALDVASGTCDRPAVQALVKEHVPEASLVQSSFQEVVYSLPIERTPDFHRLFQQLELDAALLGVDSFGISAPTMDEVFKTAIEGDDEELVFHAGAGTANSSVKTEEKSEGKSANAAQPLTGAALFAMQFKAMFLKRWQHARRDKRAMFSQLGLPVLFVTLAMTVATIQPYDIEQPWLNLSPKAFSKFCDLNEVPAFPYPGTGDSGPSAIDAVLRNAGDDYTPLDLRTSEVMTELREMCEANDNAWQATFGEPLQDGLCGGGGTHNVSRYMLATEKTNGFVTHGAMTADVQTDPAHSGSGYGLSDSTAGRYFRAWFDSRDLHSLPAFINMANNAMLRSRAGSDKLRITTHSQPFAADDEFLMLNYLLSGIDLVVSMFIIIALSFVPGSFLVYLVGERTSKAKHLQLSSGVSRVTFWLANFAWDYACFLLMSAMCWVVFAAFGLAPYSGRNIGAIIVLFVTYGGAMIPFMYLGVYIFTIPSTAYVAAVVFNLFIGITCTLTTYILDFFPKNEYLVYVNGILQQAFFVFPNYCLSRGLVEIAANEYLSQFQDYAAQIEQAEEVGFKHPLSWLISGRNATFMVVEMVVFMLFLLLVEYAVDGRLDIGGRLRKLFGLKKSSSSKFTEEGGEPFEEDVAREAALATKASDNPLHVRSITKKYEKLLACGKQSGRELAVSNLSFVVHPHECFGLLGVNGAGKTTSFRMITGDLGITEGEAWVAGNSVVSNNELARRHFGYCPQFDALCYLMTGREHLELHSRLRGTPECLIPSIVEANIKQFGLRRWADKIASSYSGGNKRKLSLAIALLGQPELLLLDEPTCGMDPNARRFVWDRVNDEMRKGRSVVLTSHSMQECQTLCSRIGIMVNGQLQCLGSPQHLKSKYGDGYTLILKVPPAAVAAAQEFVCDTFAGAVLEEEHSGYLHYMLPKARMPPLSEAFRLLESSKDRLGLEDYQVSQTSLDEIFCKFAMVQDSDSRDDVLAAEGHLETTTIGTVLERLAHDEESTAEALGSAEKNSCEHGELLWDDAASVPASRPCEAANSGVSADGGKACGENQITRVVLRSGKSANAEEESWRNSIV